MSTIAGSIFGIHEVVVGCSVIWPDPWQAKLMQVIARCRPTKDWANCGFTTFLDGK
jgi:hypothetical protein